jgi:Zn-dependent oligopeptidase
LIKEIKISLELFKKLESLIKKQTKILKLKKEIKKILSKILLKYSLPGFKLNKVPKINQNGAQLLHISELSCNTKISTTV